MSVSKNCANMAFLKMKTSTSTGMGHVGEQKPCENGFFGNESVDINEDLAFQGCWKSKTEQKPTNFNENSIFP